MTAEKTMNTQKARTVYTVTLFVLDAISIILAFILAYYLRRRIDWPDPLTSITPLVDYVGLIAIQLFTVMTTLLMSRHYYIPRAVSRIDQFYRVTLGVTLGTMMAVAVTAFVYKNNEAV